MLPSYSEMTAKWEAMEPQTRLDLLAAWWPKLPEPLQVCLLGLVHAMLGSLDLLTAESC